MPKHSPCFVAVGVLALSAVLLGFGRTYALPLSRGTFAPPWLVHLHGAFARSWVPLFLAQPMLVRCTPRDRRGGDHASAGFFNPSVMPLRAHGHGRFDVARGADPWGAVRRSGRHQNRSPTRLRVACAVAVFWIVVAMLRDELARGTVHPAFLFGGVALVVEQALEVLVRSNCGARCY